MKKVQKLLISALCVAMGACALVACGDETENNNPNVDDGSHVVTFYDGTSVLSTQNVEENGKATKPAENPTKDGYEFVRWYATPTYTIPYDFDNEVTEATSVFAGFRSTAGDDHTWYLAGESVSDLFAATGEWKEYKGEAAPPANVTMQKGNKENVYTFRHDFYAGDKFQILNTVDGWNGTTFSGQIGYGYMNPDQYSTETTANIYGSSNPYSDTAKKGNFIIGVSGNYTITLTVDANNNSLTEISYVREGDAAVLEADYNYYIKGRDVTAWQNMLVDYTRFATEDNEVYTLVIGMNADDQFMFLAENIVDADAAIGNLNSGAFTIASDDTTTAEVLNVPENGGNFSIKGGAGTYTFTITEDGDSRIFSAEKTAETKPAYDFYVKGGFGGDSSWQERHAMTANQDGTYSYEVELAENDQFQIVAVAHGDEALPDGSNDLFKNGIGAKYANGASMSNQIDITGANFKATAADSYTITIDPVSMRVTVVGEHDTVVYAVVLHGSFGGASWADGAKTTVSTDNQTLTGTINVTLAVGDVFGVKTYKDSDPGKTQIGWGAAGLGDALTLCDGIEVSQNNIGCTAAGTYTITVVIDAQGQVVSVTAAVATAE